MKIILPSLLLLTAVFTSSAPALAEEAKRVVVCSVTTGFRHSSIGIGEKTLQKLADESKAFVIADWVRQPSGGAPKKPNKPKDLPATATPVDKAKYDAALKKYEEDLAKWTPEYEAEVKLKQASLDDAVKKELEKLSPANLAAQKIDGVIFLNTTGDLPLADKEGFVKWVEAGHGFVGIHSASDTFHHYPGFLEMLGGEFDTHKAQVPVDLTAGDPQHPANAGIGETWKLGQEEMYLIKNQDRAKVHAIWFLRHHPNDVNAAGFFPVAWSRAAGKGRVFYTSLGHREDLWSEDETMKDRKNSPEMSKQFQAQLLGGIKWSLGLVEGKSEPNPEVK